MEAQRAICTSKCRSGGPFRPHNGGLGGRPKKFRKTVELSTRVHNLQLEIGVSTRPNVDKTKRAWVANSSQDVRSEGGEPSSNCMSIFLNIQTSIGRRGSAGVAKRLEFVAPPRSTTTSITWTSATTGPPAGVHAICEAGPLSVPAQHWLAAQQREWQNRMSWASHLPWPPPL